MLLEKFVAPRELKSAFACRQQAKEKSGALAQPGQGLQQSWRHGLLLLQRVFNVAGQLFESQVADGDTEIAGGNVFQFVGLVKNHGGKIGQDAGIRRAALPQGQVGEEQMVVDDDNVALQRPAAHFRNEAALPLFALLTGAAVSVTFSHSAICLYWSISSSPDKIGWSRNVTSF